MRKPLKSIIGILAMSGCAVGAAQEAETGTQYLGFLGSYVRVDDDRGVDDGLGVHALYGWRAAAGWGLEGHIFGSVFETGGSGDTDFYQQGLGLDLTYAYLDDEAISPFVFAGVGVMRNDVSGPEDDHVGYYGNFGVGLLSSSIGKSDMKLRAEARYVYDDFKDGLNDWRFNLGVEIPFGRHPQPVKPEPIVLEKPVVLEKVVERLVPPPDADGDGVPDAVDQCPDTLAGVKVDRFGCAEEAQTVELHGVTFEFDSARLTESSRYILDQVASALRGQPSMQVEIAGHTDSVGTEEYNMRLSVARAESVRNYLVFRGIDESRFTAVGYGEVEPIADNSTDQGRDLNRRIEFRILSH